MVDGSRHLRASLTSISNILPLIGLSVQRATAIAACLAPLATQLSMNEPLATRCARFLARVYSVTCASGTLVLRTSAFAGASTKSWITHRCAPWLPPCRRPTRRLQTRPAQRQNPRPPCPLIYRGRVEGALLLPRRRLSWQLRWHALLRSGCWRCGDGWGRVGSRAGAVARRPRGWLCEMRLSESRKTKFSQTG